MTGGIYLLIGLAAAVLAALYVHEYRDALAALRVDLLNLAAALVWRLSAEVGRVSTVGALWLSQRAANLEDRADPDWEALP